jgi:hypothetical protein
MKQWTEREALLVEDRALIAELAETVPEGARILVTGEARIDYLGKDALLTFSLANNILPEPLFVQTQEGTVRMTRFQPEAVWRCFHPNILMRLVQEESERLRRELVPMEEFDFYRSLILNIRQNLRNEPCMPEPGGMNAEEKYQTIYLGALVLFDKPWYMDVPVASHFALADAERFLAGTRFRPLNLFEANQWEKAKADGEGKTRLTTQELEFLEQMYENGVRGKT